MRIRLSDADRERFGCPEWLDIRLDAVSNKEAVAIQKVLGFDSLVDIDLAWRDQFRKRSEDDQGRTVVKPDYDVWDVIVWLALRQAGALTAQTREDLRAELDGITYEVVKVAIDVDDEEPAGKAQTS